MSDRYARRLAQIKQRYEGEIAEILGRIRAAMLEDGYQCTEIAEESDDEFEWLFFAARDLDTLSPNDLTFRFTICEQHEREGLSWGLNFMLNCSDAEGRIVGSEIPYNFTPGVWVRIGDDEAIEARFDALRQTSVVQWQAHVAWYQVQVDAS